MYTVWAAIILLLVILTPSSHAFDITRHLASKSPYPVDYISRSNVVGKGGRAWGPIDGICELKQVQLVARHGTRNPGTTDTREFAEVHAFLVSQADSLRDEFKWIVNWTNPFRVKYESLLVKKGEDELRSLGTRFKGWYPELFE
ncbi:hypothetical protein HK104_005183 [Borealophlyctis nickersoniae]|nr:hypothetical protein HK104_005183 [Borealophlyctis nickersoniae]